MASRIIGIDLGAYSVKVVIVAPGFRTSTVVDCVERVVPRGDEPHDLRAAAVVGQIVREFELHHDTPFCAVSGDQVFIHILEFPFRNLRRQDLAKAVGTELETILPVDLEEMVYAFEPLPREVHTAPQPAVAADPSFVQPTLMAAGRVAAPAIGMRVLACAMRQDRARSMLDRMSEQGAQPRGLIAVPAAYRRVAERIAVCQASKAAGPHVAIIDMGHERTDVCVVIDDRVDYVRTIHRGGRELTEAIATTWKMPFERAEEAKHTDSFIASSSLPAGSEAWARIHECLQPIMAPLARDLRRTLSACRAKTGASVQAAVIIGGGARVNGMAEYLTEQLGIQVSRLTTEDSAHLIGDRLASSGVRADAFCLAAGVAFEGATGRPQFDLRQGSLAYKADLSFLRAKAGQLVAAGLIVIAFAAFSAYASLYKLRRSEKTLDERLALETTAEWGKVLTADEVLERIGPAESRKHKSAVPEMTAYDLLLALNQTLPDRAEVKLDIFELDIKGDKVTLRGESAPTEKADALAGIDKLEQGLKASRCFKDYTSGETQPGPNDSREFSLTIKVACDKGGDTKTDAAKTEAASPEPSSGGSN